MSERFYGSLDVTEIIDLANKKHSAFFKTEGGKIKANIQAWLNDTPDKYGNLVSIQLNPTENKIEEDGRPYIANLKLAADTAFIPVSSLQPLPRPELNPPMMNVPTWVFIPRAVVASERSKKKHNKLFEMLYSRFSRLHKPFHVMLKIINRAECELVDILNLFV